MKHAYDNKAREVRRIAALATVALAAGCSPDGSAPPLGARVQAAKTASAVTAGHGLAFDALMWVEQQKLVAMDGAAGEQLGTAVALSGDTAIAGAPGDIDASTGSAYVFVRSGGSWQEQQKLTASDGGPTAIDSLFGAKVALSGDTAIVGAENDQGVGPNQGAAYVFVRSGGVWTEQAKLTASGGAGDDHFGSSVATFGDTALVGASGYPAGQGSGAAYVFARSGSQWTELARIEKTNPASGELFGTSVALSADTAVVGTPFEGGGSAYVFVLAGGVWTEQAKLVASDAAAADELGRAVALSGDTAAAGAYRSGGAGMATGAAYVFVRSGGTWTEQAKLTASDGANDDQFGISVALSGDTAFIGAVHADGQGTSSGSAYVFARNGGTWSEQSKLVASDAMAGAAFGASVAVTADTALVGANLGDTAATNAGGAYVFVLKLSLGDGCTAAAECASGHCVDGVCCDAVCGGGDMTDCEACSVAAGAATDGSCGLLVQGRTCRAAIGSCDLAEVCSGGDAVCPPDTVATASTECRAAGGACDVAETCDGSGKVCPPNVVVPAGTECRPADGPCDVAEACDGSDLACPSDGFVAAGSECRAAVGTCDLAEVCDGSSVDCPSDLQADRGTPCPGGTCVLGDCVLAPPPQQDEGGCGCRLAGERPEPSEGQVPKGAWLLAAFALLALKRRPHGGRRKQAVSAGP